MSTWIGGVSTDWGNALNWGPGGVGTGVPGVGVDAIFDATSINPCTTGATLRNCRDLITTGFSSVLTLAANINVNRNATFGSSTTQFGVGSVGNINMNISGNTITSASPSVIIPGLSNAGFNFIINLVGTISINRFAPAGGSTFNSALAGTFIEIVNGGSLQGNGGPGTNVTLRINGACTVNAAGYVNKGTTVLASGSTLTMNGALDYNNAGSALVPASIDFSQGTLVPNTQSFRVQNTSWVAINLGTNNFYDASFNGTIILASAINIINNLNITIANFTGAFDVTVGGNISGGSLTQLSPNRKLIITGTSTLTSTISNLTIQATLANTYRIEIACGSRGFALTGTLGPNNTIIDYLTSNTGTFTTTGSTISYTAGTCTISMIGRGSTYSWNAILNTGVSHALVLLSDVYCNTYNTILSGSQLNGPGFFLNVSGNITTMNTISGNGGLKFIGNTPSTWTQNAATTNSIARIEFAKTGVTSVSIPNSFTSTGCNFIYTSGTVNHTATLTLGNTTFTNTTTIPWNNITVNAGATITIN